MPLKLLIHVYIQIKYCVNIFILFSIVKVTLSGDTVGVVIKREKVLLVKVKVRNVILNFINR